MKLIWVVAGIFFEGILGLLAFMLVVFAGGGYANGGDASLVKVFDAFMWMIPLVCAIGSVMTFVAYLGGWSAQHYWWLALPISVSALAMVWTFTR